jgi:tetratricopeptide (TPR) repeat protein
VLGNVLLRKEEKELALENFLKAANGKGDLPPEIDARLNESIGETYFGIKNYGQAAAFFTVAKGLYEKFSKDADGRRVGRKLATARFLLGDLPAAIEAARDQRNLEGDKESLLLLARFQTISEKFEEADIWLQKALKIDPADREVRSRLAEVHSTTGYQQLASKNYTDARRHFTRSLEYRDDAGVRYALGYAAYQLDTYADAIKEFKLILDVPAENASLQWTEASWLMLLECYLLTGKFDEVEKSGPEAEKATVRLTDPRAVINYLRFVARVLKNPSAPADRLAEEPTYKELQTNRSASAKKLDWSDGKINVFIGKRDLKPDTKQVLDRARQALLR